MHILYREKWSRIFQVYGLSLHPDPDTDPGFLRQKFEKILSRNIFLLYFKCNLDLYEELLAPGEAPIPP
jgi:hypothetical protein